MNRADWQLEHLLLERLFDGSLLDGELLEAAALDPDVSTEIESLLEGPLLTGLVEETALDDDSTWEELMANLRAEDAAEDLKEVAGRIDERVRVLKL